MATPGEQLERATPFFERANPLVLSLVLLSVPTGVLLWMMWQQGVYYREIITSRLNALEHEMAKSNDIGEAHVLAVESLRAIFESAHATQLLELELTGEILTVEGRRAELAAQAIEWMTKIEAGQVARRERDTELYRLIRDARETMETEAVHVATLVAAVERLGDIQREGVRSCQ